MHYAEVQGSLQREGSMYDTADEGLNNWKYFNIKFREWGKRKERERAVRRRASTSATFCFSWMHPLQKLWPCCTKCTGIIYIIYDRSAQTNSTIATILVYTLTITCSEVATVTHRQESLTSLPIWTKQMSDAEKNIIFPKK